MKLNKILIVGLLILLLIIIKIPVIAFSLPLRQFINQKRKLRLLIYEDKEKLFFTPVEDIKVTNLGDSVSPCQLIKDRNYIIQFQDKKKENLTIQVFASAERKKAMKIKNNLIKAGYQSIIVRKEKRWFKVKVGNFISKEEALPVIKRLKKDGWDTWLTQFELIEETESVSSKLGIYTPEGELLISGQFLSVKGNIKIDNSFYQGEFQILKSNKGIKIFNQVGLKYLLYGVLESGFKENYKREILQAQAIIYRSYILSQLFYDNYNYLKIPVYQGISLWDNTIIEAVNLTEGQILKLGSGEDIQVSDYKIDGMFAGYLDKIDQNTSYREILNYFYPQSKLVDLTKKIENNLKVKATVESGLKYREIRQLTWWGPRVITVLDLNLERSELSVEPVLAGGKIFGLEDLAIIVKKYGYLAGVNGGFFSYTGHPLGLFVKKGEIISEPIKNRTAFAITREGEIIIDRISWYGQLINKRFNQMVKVTGVNRKLFQNEIVIFNHYYGQRAPLIKSGVVELIIINNEVQEIN